MHFITLNFLFAITIINVKCQCDSDKLTPYIHFMYFTGQSINDQKIFPFSSASSILQESTFDMTLPTIFFFHGWMDDPLQLDSRPDQSWNLVVPLLLSQHVNLIVLAYGPLMQQWGGDTLNTLIKVAPSYVSSVENVTCMANPLQLFFNEFFSQCKCLSNTQFIGFSLGAQLAGFTARGLTEKLPRIIGIDPAGPLFELKHIEPSDASFVEIIHSSAGTLGTLFSCGTADFWPNNGIHPQPGCSLLDAGCSHVMGLKYFINSLSDPSAYLVKGEHMGYWTTSDAKGNYYFRTS